MENICCVTKIFAAAGARLPADPRHVGGHAGGEVPGERHPAPDPAPAKTEVPVSQGRGTF